MGDLLIHSMAEFRDIIAGGLAVTGARTIVEIGAEFGGTSALLADHAAAHDGALVSIDPAPKPAFLDWCAAHPAVTHVAAPSLSVIGEMADVDAWVIDGDHNWFTVYHELKAIEAVCARDARPMLCFLHDVCWPSGRRDMYYAPATIPPAFLHPHDAEAGAMPGESALVPGRGFRGMGHFSWATHEGGPRNGVKTAIEDFIATSGRSLAYAEVPAVFGLGVLFDMDAPWSQALAELVVPFHENPLIAALERNRLANYLAVIDWQDREAARAAA